MNIQKNIESFIDGERKSKGRKPTERYASFDYCFNYFQSYKEAGNQSALIDLANIQTSCLQLAFYLASWGMFRGPGGPPFRWVSLSGSPIKSGMTWGVGDDLDKRYSVR